MKIKSIVLLILIIMISITGCSDNEDVNLTEDSVETSITKTFDPNEESNTSHNIDPLVQKEGINNPDHSLLPKEEFDYNSILEEKRYLWINGITVEEMTFESDDNNSKIWMAYPRIYGLLDTKVEDFINNDLKEFFMDYAKELVIPEDVMDKLDMDLYVNFGVESNYNNILSIVARRHNSYSELYDTQPFYTLTYDLNTGKRLSLEDIFYKGSDYIDLINKEISVQIIRKNIDEDYMKRPFSGISGNEFFYLSDTDFVICFSPNNQFFGNYYFYNNYPYGGISFSIPIKNLKGAFWGYDIFWQENKNIYTADTLRKKMFPVKYSKDIKEEQITDGYSFYLRYTKIKSLDDETIQERINSLIIQKKEQWLSQTDSYIKNKVKSENYKSINIEGSIDLSGDFGNYFSFNYYWGGYDHNGGEHIYGKSGFIFDLVTGKSVDFKELIKNPAEFTKTALKYMKDNHYGYYENFDIKTLESTLVDSVLSYDQYSLNLSLKTGIGDETLHFYIPFEEFDQNIFKLFD